MIRVEKNGVRWLLHPDTTPLLDEILTGEKSRVKESPSKLITVNQAAGREFFVKRYRYFSSPFRPLKFFFKDSQARQEWKLAQVLERLGVPIVKHVAIGERWSAAGLLESILITEKFDGKPLLEVAGLDGRAVLDFVATLHLRGVLHSDLHPGNILAAADNVGFRLVDLHGIKIKPYINNTERAENLACLKIFLPLPVSEEVEEKCRILRKSLLHQRSERSFKNNREFRRERFGKLNWQVRLPLLTMAAEKIFSDPDRFLSSRAEILKNGRTATVGKADGLVLKRFNFKKPLNLAKDFFRRSHAMRSFRKAYHLELAGVPTAGTVGASDFRVCGFLLRSCLLMQEIPGATELRRWRGAKSHAVSAAATLIAKLHDEGFSHRDLKETNLIFDLSGKLFLIDLEGLDFVGNISKARAVVDLERLARGAENSKLFSRTDFLNFLRRYCGARKISPRKLFARGAH